MRRAAPLPNQRFKLLAFLDAQPHNVLLYQNLLARHDDHPTQLVAITENHFKLGDATDYQELAKALDILPPHSIHQVTEALERLMEEDAAADRPFIAALAISKTRGGLPAPGFFDCARRLDRFADGQDARTFHAAELNAVFARWGGSRNN